MYLTRLIYFSRSTLQERGVPIAAEIKKILDTAHRVNAEEDLTGVLVFNNAFFAQAIEGDRRAVSRMYARIAADPRHADQTIVTVEPIEKRKFVRWWMGYAGRSQVVDELYLRYGVGIGFNPAQMTANALLDFMEDLVRNDSQVISYDSPVESTPKSGPSTGRSAA